MSPSSDEEAAPKPVPAKYDLQPSSPSPPVSDNERGSPSPPISDNERGSRRKDRKRRKQRREKEHYDGAAASRKPGVRAWAGETKMAKDYYLDAKGDQDNLAFGSIYRSKRLWLDEFQKLSSILTLKELSDLQEVMNEKELHIRTDIYEILLEDETEI